MSAVRPPRQDRAPVHPRHRRPCEMSFGRFRASSGSAQTEDEPLALRMVSDVDLVTSAVANNMLSSVRVWLDEMAGDVNVKGGVGMTPLHVAAISGHDEMVRLLLSSLS